MPRASSCSERNSAPRWKAKRRNWPSGKPQPANARVSCRPSAAGARTWPRPSSNCSRPSCRNSRRVRPWMPPRRSCVGWPTASRQAACNPCMMPCRRRIAASSRTKPRCGKTAISSAMPANGSPAACGAPASSARNWRRPARPSMYACRSSASNWQHNWPSSRSGRVSASGSAFGNSTSSICASRIPTLPICRNGFGRRPRLSMD
ncbi:hypothetical protein D3C78_737480 [compost metagenome]